MANIRVELKAGIFQDGALRSRLREIVEQTSLRVEASAKQRIQTGSKTGRVYRKSSIKKKTTKGLRALGLSKARGASGAGRVVAGYNIHRASAPGESPATDTGFLATAIRARETEETATTIKGQVVADAKYAAALEFGTRKIKPRPFLAPALAEAEPAFVINIENLVKGLS